MVFFGDLRITSLLYVDDVLLATWSMDLQFAARCEVAGMRTPQKGGVLTLVCEGSPGAGVQVSWGLFHSWGGQIERETRDGLEQYRQQYGR